MKQETIKFKKFHSFVFAGLLLVAFNIRSIIPVGADQKADNPNPLLQLQDTDTPTATLTATSTATSTPTSTPTPSTGLYFISGAAGCTSGPYITCSGSVVSTHTDPYRWDFDITYTYGDNRTNFSSNFTYVLHMRTGVFYKAVPIYWNMYPITNEVMPNRSINVIWVGVPDLNPMPYPSGSWTIGSQPSPYQNFDIGFSRVTTNPEILVRTDKWHLTLSTYPNVATPTITPTPTNTPTKTLTPTNTPTITPTSTATPTPTCSASDLEVQAVTGSNGAIPFYGVGGESHVWDPTVAYDGDYVNSIWILTDAQNILELGWIERGEYAGAQRTYFRTWTVLGIYHFDSWGTPIVSTDHDFQLYNVNGDQEWRFFVDGVRRDPNILANFRYGITGAMRERKTTCDSGTAHWWNLQRCDYVCNWSSWQTIDERNSDWGWFLDVVSPSEFYVNPQ